MGNCCRLFVQAPINKVKEVLTDCKAVMRFGNNPIVMATESHFGSVRPDMLNCVEVNCINEVNKVCKLLQNHQLNVLCLQDLDGYGINTYFKINC